MKLLRLSIRSAWNRRAGLLLTIFSIALSIMLLLGVDKIRKEARNSFVNTISQTDLIVGARSGPINLLLYSIFHIGDATNNISWETYQEISSNKAVRWAVPISLGDSHRGYRVMGTSRDYFQHYQYGRKQSLQFSQGAPFDDLYEAVIGAEVAKKLGYKLADEITLNHGTIQSKNAKHEDKPFIISGILKQTGTPVDRAVLASLTAIEAIHIDWKSGRQLPLKITAEQTRRMNLVPQSITAMMLGLNNRIATFSLQREINEYKAEPLLAILPGATLSTLWQTMGTFEQILLVIAALVLVAGLFGMMTTLLSTLNERRREMAILRAVGAHPYHILLLLMIESVLIIVIGCLVGVLLLYALLFMAQPYILDTYGIHFSITLLDTGQYGLMTAALILGIIFSLIPGYIAYRRSLTDGLIVRT